MKKIREEASVAAETNKARIKAFRLKTRKVIKKLQITDEVRNNLYGLLGNGSHLYHLHMGDMKARAKLMKVLLKHFRRLKKSKQGTGTRFFMGSFIDDSGSTSDRVPFVDLEFFQDKVYRAVRLHNLDAIIVMEVHPIMNHPGKGLGRTLAFGAHVIAWTDDERFSAHEASLALSASRGWKNHLGAQPVLFEEIGSTAADLERVCYYLLKPPHSAKNLMPNNAKPGRLLLMDTTTGYRPDLAFRVFEGLTQIEVAAAITAVGGGRHLRKSVLQDMDVWAKKRNSKEPSLPADFDVWKFWYDLRRDLGTVLYLPYRIRGGGMMPKSCRVAKDAKSRPSRSRRGRKHPSKRVKRLSLSGPNIELLKGLMNGSQLDDL